MPGDDPENVLLDRVSLWAQFLRVRTSFLIGFCFGCSPSKRSHQFSLGVTWFFALPAMMAVQAADPEANLHGFNHGKANMFSIVAHDSGLSPHPNSTGNLPQRKIVGFDGHVQVAFGGTIFAKETSSCHLGLHMFVTGTLIFQSLSATLSHVKVALIGRSANSAAHTFVGAVRFKPDRHVWGYLLRIVLKLFWLML